MATALHSARTRFFDKCGKPLCGGTVYTYQVGTTTNKTTYTDVSKTAVNTNPVILDSIGSAAIFLDGAYRVRVLDRNGVLVEDIAYIESWLSATEKDAIYQTISDVDAVVTEHVANTTNPHRVTKAQIGLDQVDNTADIDKPLSNATKTYIDDQDMFKADKSTTYTKTEVDTKVSSVSGGYIGAFATLSELQAKTGMTVGQIAKVMNDTAANNGDYRYTGSAWVKGYDALADAKNYTDTKAAESKAYTDTVSKNNADYYQTENIVNPSQTTGSGAWDASGNPNGNTSYTAALDYYAVSPNQKIWSSVVSGGTVLAIYDTNKAFIGTINTSTNVNGVYTIPATMNSKTPAFIRVATIGTSLANVRLGYGDTTPPVVLAYQQKYSVVRNTNFTDAINKVIIANTNQQLKQAVEQFDFSLYDNHLVLFKNLVNPSQAVQQGYFGDSGVTAAPTIPNFYAGLDSIPVPLNRKMWLKGLPGGYTIQLMDINKNPVKAVHTNDIVNGIYNVPLTAGSANKDIYYIRVATSGGETGFADNKVGVGWASDLGYAPTSIPAYNADVARLSQQLLNDTATRLGISVNPLSGKKWVAMGDSITVGGSYADSIGSYAKILSDKYLATLELQAQNGARVHREADGVTASSVLSERYLNITTTSPDLITIAGGVNDPIKPENTPDGTNHLGTMADRTNRTFYGALHVLLSGLRDKFPHARIGYIAPIPNIYGHYDSNDPNNIYWIKYKAIRDVCEYYAIPVWNGCTQFGAHPSDTDWKDAYMPDGLHPNNAGHQWYANRVEDFILNLAR